MQILFFHLIAKGKIFLRKSRCILYPIRYNMSGYFLYSTIPVVCQNFLKRLSNCHKLSEKRTESLEKCSIIWYTIK